MPDRQPPVLPPAASHPAVQAPHSPGSQPLSQLLAELADAWSRECPVGRLVLSKYRGELTDLQRVTWRPVRIKGQWMVQAVWRHTTRDHTENLPLAQALQSVAQCLEADFQHAHWLDCDQPLQLLISKKGRMSLQRDPSAPGTPAASSPSMPASPSLAAPDTHNREKRRFVDVQARFLTELGVTDAQHRVIPAMARKWKQINKFVEVYRTAHAQAGLPAQPGQALRVVDFGSGKGYLTFALHAHLRNLGLVPEVMGVELRAELVALCQQAAQRCGATGLSFVQGDVRSVVPQDIDVMVALHACDVATDYAIHTGIRRGAAVIMCSPCCHKELRPQLLSPHPMRPILQHGIHLGQQAEMLTDGLRALLLEAHGFDAQIFEFVALEHTSKNKMILAVRRQEPAGAAQARRQRVLVQVQEIKAHYSLRTHTLEMLLASP
jgi:hypothetical protein